MTTITDKSVELGYTRKPAKRTLSLSGKWKNFSALANDFAHHTPDEWSYIVDSFPTEQGTRYRYDISKREFIVDKVSVKLDNKPFAHGAMRECFRAKKLSKFVQKDGNNNDNNNQDWHLPFSNVVAKRYFKEADRKTYFDDVKLQMDAKYWAEEYNRANPPKKIDIMQMMILEADERPDKPLYHVETVIEGEYVKYNSNSGFVDSDSHRNTPQAFSHFTFEASGHKIMVVDVQGVGDIYTDPQIHTYNGEGYGSGNLATKGMALFFNTHRCNVICEALGLSKFDLTKKERKRTNTMGDGATCLRSGSFTSSEGGTEEKDLVERDLVFDSGIEDSTEKWSELPNVPKIRLPSSSLNSPPEYPARAWDTEELARSHLYNSNRRRPSCVVGATQSRERSGEQEERPENLNCEKPMLVVEERATILGQVHFDLALYHYMGRFEDDKTADNASAIFHLTKAADCGLNLAEFTLACLHLNIYHDELKELELNENLKSETIGFQYLEKAAKHGNLTAIITVGHTYHQGLYGRSRDWLKAIKYFNKYTECSTCSAVNSTFEPTYQILGKIAEIYQYGGHGVTKDPLKSGELYTEAAEAAMSAMNGRLANKWFMLAEEVWAECEE